MNSEKSILITGSSGFIGKNLAEKLSALYKVYAPKTDELDLNDQYKVEQFFRSHKINIVIHAANYRGKLGQNVQRVRYLNMVLECMLILRDVVICMIKCIISVLEQSMTVDIIALL